MTLIPLLLQLAVAAPAPAADTTVVEAAIVAAVRGRMGDEATVRLTELHVPPSFVGVPVRTRLDPGARLGGIVRFNLARVDPASGEAQAFAGSARAVVHVTVPHLHARHEIARGAEVTAADVELVSHEMSGGFEPWPGMEVIGTSRAMRRIVEGACLGRTSLLVQPAVQRGQTVEAVARVGALEVVARLVAADRGDVGDVVRVVNPESRRTLKARIVAPGAVEVLHD